MKSGDKNTRDQESATSIELHVDKTRLLQVGARRSGTTRCGWRCWAPGSASSSCSSSRGSRRSSRSSSSSCSSSSSTTESQVRPSGAEPRSGQGVPPQWSRDQTLECAPDSDEVKDVGKCLPEVRVQCFRRCIMYNHCRSLQEFKAFFHTRALPCRISIPQTLPRHEVGWSFRYQLGFVHAGACVQKRAAVNAQTRVRCGPRQELQVGWRGCITP